MKMVLGGCDLASGGPCGKTLVDGVLTCVDRRGASGRRRGRVVEPGMIPEDRNSFASAIRRELTPEGVLEQVLAARVALFAWRLHQDSLLAGMDRPDASTTTEHDARELLSALQAFDVLRARRSRDWGRVDHVPSPVPPVAGESESPDDLAWDHSGPADPPLESFESEDAEDVSALWRDRLLFEPDVSESSPVVRGTWVTVQHIVSLVVDGWSWSDILRTHPELTEADIRACLAYAVEEEGAGRLEG